MNPIKSIGLIQHSDPTTFAKELWKTISELQAEDRTVEIQYTHGGSVLSALVITR